MPDQSNAPDFRPRFTGKKNLLPSGRSGFFKDINDLCSGAGLTGTVPIRVLGQLGMRSKKDSPNAGWHVSTPGSYGVPLSWVESPDRALRLMVRVDGITDVALYERLKESLAEKTRWPTEKGEKMDNGTDSVLAPMPAALITADPPLGKPSVGEALAAAPVEGGKEEEMRAATRFVSDDTAVELFLHEMATYADEKGKFGTREGVEVLRGSFGFPQVAKDDDPVGYNQPYVALDRLAELGELDKREDEYGYYIPQEKLAQIRGEASTTDAPATTREGEETGAMSTPSGGASALVRLMNDAGEIERFLLAMTPVANPRGEFKALQGVAVLRESFGFPDVTAAEDSAGYSQAYNALSQLARRSKLNRLEFGYRIPQEEFNRLKLVLAHRVAADDSLGEVSPPASSSGASPTAPPASPADAAPEPAPPLQRRQRRPRAPAHPRADDLWAEIDKLRLGAERYNAAAGRQDEALAELEAVRAQLGPLRERERALGEEIASLAKTVGDAELREQAEEYAKFSARIPQLKQD